eukprot:scaffold40154_cov33-Tisochrysis_lutea.AAC.2
MGSVLLPGDGSPCGHNDPPWASDVSSFARRSASGRWLIPCPKLRGGAATCRSFLPTRLTRRLRCIMYTSVDAKSGLCSEKGITTPSNPLAAAAVAKRRNVSGECCMEAAKSTCVCRTAREVMALTTGVGAGAACMRARAQTSVCFPHKPDSTASNGLTTGGR